MGIRYLDGSRLRRALIAAADWVDADREELNRINVFPVPDGDTGTNFSLTLQAVSRAVERLERPALPEVTKAMADSSVLSAHGNSGLLLSQFLLGFRERLGNIGIAGPLEVAEGIRGGADRLYAALDAPVEGTILTVSREVADAAKSLAPGADDFVRFMDRILERAWAALERTPDLLPSLREAGVVDAGAKAFVLLLEGIVRLIKGESLEAPTRPVSSEIPYVASQVQVDPDRDFQFCTEVLVRGAGFPPTIRIREELRNMGGSIVVLSTEDLLKIHVHTDYPDRVYELAGGWGDVETTKADDMREQHRALHDERDGSVAIVVDSASDLSDALIDKHRIVVVPMQLMSGAHTYRDRVDIQAQDIYSQMRQDKTAFTTSQPPPGAFVQAFEDAAAEAPSILCLTVAGNLSGTIGAAQTAAATIDESTPIAVFDSRTASLGLGMLALRARELADEGWNIDRIVEELDRIRDNSGSLVVFDTLENLVRSGRIGRGRAFIGNLLDFKPIFEIDLEGRVTPIDRVRGREAVLPRLFELLDDRLARKPRRLRIGLVHADALEVVESLAGEIRQRYEPYECLIDDVTAAIGVHAGPGAIGVFYQVEDQDVDQASDALSP